MVQYERGGGGGLAIPLCWPLFPFSLDTSPRLLSRPRQLVSRDLRRASLSRPR